MRHLGNGCGGIGQEVHYDLDMVRAGSVHCFVVGGRASGAVGATDGGVVAFDTAQVARSNASLKLGSMSRSADSTLGGEFALFLVVAVALASMVLGGGRGRGAAKLEVAALVEVVDHCGTQHNCFSWEANDN